ncbi:MAG: DUF664 domain-containing protein [Gemmatimonadetes bacterium]|nr:DUF664 domain-containing protein [Gemmatimonadota bacterium]MCA9767864.1 DUF664 domain-containing protein [Gemmatimonadota bacterium]
MSVFADVRSTMVRDLEGFVAELHAYPDEASVWALPPGFLNSGGTLALHAAGNIRHFVGAVLGETGYVRDRDHEFAARGVPRAELVAELEAARADVDGILRVLDPERAYETFPVRIGGEQLGTSRVLVHLATHLAWHLGQVDYHRRAVCAVATSVGAVGLKALQGD